MSRAVFVASDPYHRAESEKKLSGLIKDIRGVTDWSIDSKGEVTIEYKPEETSSNVVEEALAGIGYRIQHVTDSERLGKADAPNMGVSEKPGGGNKYGNSNK